MTDLFCGSPRRLCNIWHRGNQDIHYYPDDTKRQAEINKWLYWNVVHWSAACSIYLFENLARGFFDMGEPDPVELKKGEEYFLRYGEVLNDHFKYRKWMVGDDVTLAGYAVASFLDHAEVV